MVLFLYVLVGPVREERYFQSMYNVIYTIYDSDNTIYTILYIVTIYYNNIHCLSFRLVCLLDLIENLKLLSWISPSRCERKMLVLRGIRDYIVVTSD